MSMTLEQVSAMLRKRSPEVLWQQSEQMADAIDVHLAHLTQPAQSVDVADLHGRIGKDLENPRFWLDGLRVAMHTTDCPAKLQALTNAHRELSKFVTAALQEKGNG